MFSLANPWVLCLVFLPLVLWFLLPQAKYYFPSAIKVPFYQALEKLILKDNFSFSSSKPLGLIFIIWCLSIIALSGPRWVGEPRSLDAPGRNIMLVLDLSGSMELADMVMNDELVTRLTVVKRAAKSFVKTRKGDKLGLILFGTKAYLLTPLTFDKASILERIDDATAGLAGQTTSIGDALGLAVKRLQAVPKESRVVILLTDGVSNSGVLTPLKAALLAKDENVKVYTIGLGADSDPRVQNDPFYNGSATSDLDEKTLKKIAAETGGRYFKATDMNSLHTIYATISSLETVKQEHEFLRPITEYYIWPLLAALFLLFVLINEKFIRAWSWTARSLGYPR